MLDLSFYKDKKVLITGHTGFKGSWLSRILINAGALVTGYSLAPQKQPNLFEIAGIKGRMTSIIGDICNYRKLYNTFVSAKPEVVFHLAAQPIVRNGYRNPRLTYETNVMGTVNMLECVRLCSCVKSVLNVTTDKVYRNNEWIWGYREEDLLCGSDPYSNSKSCSELVTYCYKKSFLKNSCVSLSTARAGNVIGGGDFANDRIIPDCIRAIMSNQVIYVRNPHSIRPYQHVLEPLTAYLTIAEKQYENKEYEGSYNIGPDDSDCITTGELVELFCRQWGDDIIWKKDENADKMCETNYLKLDCSKVKKVFDWKPCWHIEKSLNRTIRFTKVWLSGGDASKEMDIEIKEFIEGK